MDFLGEQVHMKRHYSQPEGISGTPEPGVKGRDLNLDRKQGGSKKGFRALSRSLYISLREKENATVRQKELSRNKEEDKLYDRRRSRTEKGIRVCFDNSPGSKKDTISDRAWLVLVGRTWKTWF